MAYDRESLQGLQNFNDEVFFNEKITAFSGISGNVTGNLDGNVTGNLTGNVTGNVTGNLTGNVTGDVIGNIVLSGISTFQDLRLNGKFFDGSNTFGSSGQILSSDGTKTSWINASSANVGSATSIGINLDSTNTSRLITFVDTSSGNNIVKVDNDLTYNPSTNTLTAGSFVKSGGTSSQFLKADGSADSTSYITASGTLSNTLTMNTSGTGLSGSATYNNSGNATFTVASNATSSNTSSTIVARDSSGNFSAGTITSSSFVKSGGTSSQFLKADGSSDSTSYMNYNTNFTVTYGTNSGNTTYVYPPSGFAIGDLVGFIPSRRIIYFSGGVDGNDTMYNYYSVDSGNGRIEVTSYTSEQRDTPSNNWLAIWRK